MKKISSGLKTLFLVHLITGIVFGLGYLFIPGLLMGIAGVTLADEFPWRIIGSAILGFTVSSWFCYKETDWEKVRIVVLAEIVWAGLVTLVGLYGLLITGLPTGYWINVIIMAFFAVAFAYFYTKN
jgi:hypothetical protein